MHTSLQWLRGGALLASIALVASAPVVHAAGRTAPAHRYAIYGSLETAAPETMTPISEFGLAGRLSAPAKDEVGVQSGGDYVVMAKLAAAPLGCSGNDTIFVNGFEP